jgi:phosphoglycolate phosphatase
MNRILWDLDGTLTDPRIGILRCIQYALTENGLPHVPESDLLWCIGPPLQHSFAKLAPEADEAFIWKLVEKYRERFSSVGLLENSVYPGVPELLRRLNGASHYVATSKPKVFARKIVDHFQLGPYFAAVHGSELNGVRSDKGELIQFILDTEEIEPKRAVMVGDRKHDILGAKRVGIAAVGVTWGYGSREELVNAGADQVFAEPESLGDFLLA